MADTVSFDSLVPDQSQPQQQAAPMSFDSMEDDEDKYGGFTGMAKAAALGALRGMTLSGSDYLATKSGLFTPEDIKGYHETNPVTSYGSEAVGMLTAPEFMPAALVGKAGKVVTSAAEKVGLPLAGQAMETLGLGGNSVAAKVLAHATDVGSHALGSAVEGSLYAGIGNSVNELALGDPGLNGEKVAANFGYGAILGGVAGGVLKTAGLALPPAVKATTEAISDLKEKIMGTGLEGNGGAIGRGLDLMSPEGKLSEAWGNRMTNLDSDQQKKLISGVTDTLNTIHKNVKTTLLDLNAKMRPAAIDALIDTADKAKVIDGQQGVIDQISGAISEINNPANAGLYSPNAAAKLEKMRLRLVEGLKEGNDPADIFARVKDVSQDLGAWGRGVNPSETTVDTLKLLNGVKNNVSDYLKNPDVFGVVGSNYAEHNEFLAKYYDSMPAFDKKGTPITNTLMTNVGTAKKPSLEFDPKKIESAIKSGDRTKLDALDEWFGKVKQIPEHIENTMANVPNESMDQKLLSNIEEMHAQVKEAQRKYQANLAASKGKRLGMGDIAAAALATAHPVLGGMLELYQLASRPLDTINKLAEVESIVNKTTNLIGRGVKSIFNASGKLGNVPSNVVSRLGAKEQADKKQDLHDKLSQFQADPSAFANKLGDATETLHSVAPQLAQSLQQSTANAVQFLTSKLPTKPDDNPFQKAYEPSLAEMAKFDRYLNIVEKPTLALDQIKTGLIGPDTMEALTAVYPKLLDQMRQAVQLEATAQAKKGKELPYQLRQSVSMFLGQPITSSLLPQNVMNNQAVFMQSAQAQMQKNAKPASGLKDIDRAGSLSLHPNDEASA